MRRLVVVALVLDALSCTPRARMCGAPNECGGTQACVAGRCQPVDGGTPAIAEQSDAGWVVRRIVLAPVDVAWVRRGDGHGTGMPAVFTLGREADGDAVLFTRFEVSLAKDAKIVEAYLVLQRSDALDSDPSPVSLHAARIVTPWDSRSVSWGMQPALEELRLPTTRVDPSGRAVVRLDVRALVSRWSLHDRRDQGIAVVTETGTRTGISFAFLPTNGFAERPMAALPPGEIDTTDGPGSPRLELYVK